MNRTARLVPVVAVPALVIAGAIALPAVASAAPKLPEKSAQQVLAMIADAKGLSYSGTVQQTSSLGLPQLPSSATTPGASTGASSASSVLELLSGTHRLRVYVDGATKQRVQVLDQLAERDVIRNGSTLWTWDSAAKTVTKLTLPSPSSAARSDGATTPSALAKSLLDKVQSSSTVKVTSTASVAGRDAYQVRLSPKSAGTLVKDVVLSVDAKTGLPLRVQVDAVGQKAAAFTVGFTSLQIGKPDAKLFQFSAPKGAKVTTKDLSQSARPKVSRGPVPQDPDTARPTTVGSGWSTIAILPADTKALAGQGRAGAQAQSLLAQLTRPVPGGRAVQTSLVSVLFADDGRVLVGAVPVSALQAAAG